MTCKTVNELLKNIEDAKRVLDAQKKKVEEANDKLTLANNEYAEILELGKIYNYEAPGYDEPYRVMVIGKKLLVWEEELELRQYQIQAVPMAKIHSDADGFYITDIWRLSEIETPEKANVK